MSQKVIIFGGAGFLGFSLCKQLILDKKYKITIADNFSRNKIDKEFNKLIKIHKIKLYNFDLTDYKILKKKIKGSYDYVFQFAAIVGVKNVTLNPYDVLNKNVLIMSNVIKYFKSKQIKRLFFTSTSEVYMGSLEYLKLPLPTPEDYPLALSNINSNRTSYMLSKIYGEALCIHSGLPYIILRPHNIYGPRMGFSHVIPELIKKLSKLKKKSLHLVTSPSHTRSFCYIDDAVFQIIGIMRSKAKNITLNIGNNNEEITIFNLVKELIKKINRRDIILKKGTIHKGSPNRRIPKLTLVNSLSKHKKFTNLSKGLELTSDWYLKNIE